MNATPLIASFGTNTAIYTGGGTNYKVRTPAGVVYLIFVDGSLDLAYVKSTDNELTWSAPVVIFAGSITAISVFYDKWAGLSTGYISIAFQDSGVDDTLFITIDTENSDALSTQTQLHDGATTAGGGWCSVTRTRGGSVLCHTCIDAGAEGGFFKLANADFPNGAWVSKTLPEALSTSDMMILAPGFAADNLDAMGIFWDSSADQISRYIYDDSADTWAESIFTGTFTDTPASTAFPHFALAVDLVNSQLIVVAWSRVDFSTAKLTCWTVTESAITAKTDVVANSSDDQGLAAITLDVLNGICWVFYAGKSDGSETFSTAMKLYYKASKDSLATWGPETLLATMTATDIRMILATPRIVSSLPLPPAVAYFDGAVANPKCLRSAVQLTPLESTIKVG